MNRLEDIEAPVHISYIAFKLLEVMKTGRLTKDQEERIMQIYVDLRALSNEMMDQLDFPEWVKEGLKATISKMGEGII